MATAQFDPNEDFTGNGGSNIANESDFIDSSNVPFWGDAPQSWNTIILGGFKLPGVVTVLGKAFEVRADRKKIPGVSGETLTTLGREPCEPEIKVKLWKKQHLTDFLSLIKSFLPVGSQVLPPPVTVIHPALAMFKVRAIRVMKCSYPVETQPGVFEVTLNFREFFAGKGGKPKTDKSPKIVNEGPGAVAQKINKLRTPDQTNGNEPRSRNQNPSSAFPSPASKTVSGT